MQMVGTVCSKEMFSLGEEVESAQKAPLWAQARRAEPAAITAACC